MKSPTLLFVLSLCVLSVTALDYKQKYCGNKDYVGNPPKKSKNSYKVPYPHLHCGGNFIRYSTKKKSHKFLEKGIPKCPAVMELLLYRPYQGRTKEPGEITKTLQAFQRGECDIDYKEWYCFKKTIIGMKNKPPYLQCTANSVTLYLPENMKKKEKKIVKEKKIKNKAKKKDKVKKKKKEKMGNKFKEKNKEKKMINKVEGKKEWGIKGKLVLIDENKIPKCDHVKEILKHHEVFLGDDYFGLNLKDTLEAFRKGECEDDSELLQMMLLHLLLE